MKNVLLTNATYIKSLTNISDNVSEKYMFPTINEAQEIELKHVIGSALLEKLKDLVVDQTINDPENEVYKDLLLNCQFFIAYVVVSKLTLVLSYKIDNVGTYRTADENMTYSSMRDVQTMQEYYQDKADFFKLELQNYCLNNRSKLPELTENQIHSIKSNLYSAETCGIFLGGARSKRIITPDCYRK